MYRANKGWQRSITFTVLTVHSRRVRLARHNVPNSRWLVVMIGTLAYVARPRLRTGSLSGWAVGRLFDRVAPRKASSERPAGQSIRVPTGTSTLSALNT